MKFKVLFLLLIVLYQNAFTQNNKKTVNDSTIFMAIAKTDTYLLSSPNETDINYEVPIKQGSYVYAYQANQSSSSEEVYYSIFFEKDSGYVAAKDFHMFTEASDLLTKDMNKTTIVRKNDARIYNLLETRDKYEKILKRYDSYKRKGLVLTNKEYAYSETSGLFGLELTFYNGFRQKIKYITITTRPYNRVGDISSDDIGRTSYRAKIIGPMNPDSESTVTFDEMFWDSDDIIERIRITNIKITFMNGKIKNITNIKNHLGEDVYN